MNPSHIQLYTVVNRQLHEVSISDVDKFNWSAIVTAKDTKPFYGWDGMNEIYDWKASGVVSLDRILWFNPDTLSLDVIPIAADRLFHKQIVADIEAL